MCPETKKCVRPPLQIYLKKLCPDFRPPGNVSGRVCPEIKNVSGALRTQLFRPGFSDRNLMFFLCPAAPAGYLLVVF